MDETDRDRRSFPVDSLNHRFPFGPSVMPRDPVFRLGADSLIFPSVVIRPIRLPLYSVNHRFPSGPAVIPPGSLTGVGTVNSVIVPPVVIRPIFLPYSSVNQRLPSGPAVIAYG